MKYFYLFAYFCTYSLFVFADENKTATSIKILSNKGSSSTITSSGNLTDQEKQLSENYVDQGESNRIYAKECKDDMAQACAGSEATHKVLGIETGLIKAAAQAYASFGAVGDFLPLSKTIKVDPKNSSVTKEKLDDYCKYIPTATETIAAFSQKKTVDGLNQGGETSQKEVLLKAEKSHLGRAEQATIQATGWYATSACYAGMAALGKAVVDKSLIIKLAASSFLGTFYLSEINANKNYANKTHQVAMALPSKGACNPVTQNDCYCAELENENDPNYCKAQIAKKAAISYTKIACLNDKMQIDSNCACEKSNNCFEKFLENQGAVDLQIGMGSSNSPFNSLTSLAHGKLETGSLGMAPYAGTAAIAKKALSELSYKLEANNSPLSKNDKAIADALVSRGIPSNIAHLMAQNSPSKSAVDNSLAKLSGLTSYQVASSSPGKSTILDFSGGDGLGTGQKRGDKKGSSVDDFLGKLSQKNGGTNNAMVLEFAKKAEEKAQEKAIQIRKSDKAIFEIISLRYQTTGRRLLQLDTNN